MIIASDQAIYLRGLASILLTIPELKLVGEARSGVEALHLCRLAEPDRILLDLHSQLGHQSEIVRQFCQNWAWIKLVLLQDLTDGTPEQDDIALIVIHRLE
ncbi:MAG TPA: hypothetical protein VF355_05465 [Anaerolineaceae bacterium]